MIIIRPLVSNINIKEKNTLNFAARQLQKYLGYVLDGDISVVLSKIYKPYEKNTIYLGVKSTDKLESVSDENLDDAIFIDVKNFSGLISGSNARSVLIGVYRFLKEIGFSFLRPGKGGESYPDSVLKTDVFISEKASYRHRTICIEGSVFQQNLMDIIDWIPKAAMNGYFVQFQIPRAFFDRWYLEDTPYREKVELSDEDILSIVSLAEDEIEKRSLMYHGVGHGWTPEVVGIDGTSWDVHPEPSEDVRHMLALVNGERKLWEGIPLNTSLCYSDSEVRNIMTDNVVRYCKEHPAMSYLHFWLSDGRNNNCECEGCRDKKTSEFYVMMLNELDRKLTKENLDTKIVFLIYNDLLWKPDIERFENSERFVLMFAPISRSYSVSYTNDTSGTTKPYVLNKLTFPRDVGENLAYLREWQNDFKCDSFDFDYHFMWDHYYDFPQYRHAKILSEDIKNLEQIGLGGLVSCQIQRAFLPTTLNMNVMADTLWNKNLSFEGIEEKTLKAEFGDDSMLVSQYLSSLSDYGCAKAIRGEEDFKTEECVKNLENSLEIIKAFSNVIDDNLGKSSVYFKAWEKLQFFSKLYEDMLNVYISIAKGNNEIDCTNIKDFVLANEEEYKDEFDAMYFNNTFEMKIKELINR